MSIEADVCLGPHDRALPDSAQDRGGSFDVRIVEHEQELEFLERHWCELAEAARAHPFQHFGWAKAWIQSIGRAERCKLRIVTAWKGSRLAAVWPLVCHRYSTARVLEWLGTKVSDYCDVLVHPKTDARSALLAMWSTLLRQNDFEVIRLGQVRRDARVNELLQAARLRPWIETRESSYCLPIRWRSGAQWLAEQSARTRKCTRHDLRQLKQAGFEYYVWRQPEPYEPLLEAIIAQKVAWLERNGRGPLHGHCAGLQFLRRSVAAMAQQGTLHLSALRSQSGFAACHLGFQQHGTLYGYSVTYDSAWAACSPGTAIRNALIMWACDHGIEKIDMLRGADPYKLRYHPELEPLETYVIPRGAIGAACVSAYRCIRLPGRCTDWMMRRLRIKG